MAFQKKKTAIPQEDYDDEEFEEEEFEEEPEQQQIKKAVVQETPKRQREEIPEQEEKITVNDVLLNHEERLKSIEAALFRLKNI